MGLRRSFKQQVNANPLMTMLRHFRLGAIVLIGGSLSLPAVGPVGEAAAWRAVVLSVLGAIIGLLIEMFLIRRVNLFGKRE